MEEPSLASLTGGWALFLLQREAIIWSRVRSASTTYPRLGERRPLQGAPPLNPSGVPPSNVVKLAAKVIDLGSAGDRIDASWRA